VIRNVIRIAVSGQKRQYYSDIKTNRSHHMKLKLFAICMTLILGLVNTSQADETIAIKAGFMILSPSGNFGAKVNNIGARIDLEKDLKFDNSSQPTGEINVNLGDSMVAFGFTPLNFTGQGVLARTINYNGKTFAAGSTASSEFKADLYDFSYTYFMINMDDLPSRFQLGLETSVKTINAKTNMSGAAITTAKNTTIAIPTAGLRGRVALADFVGLSGRFGYLGYAGNFFTDAEAQVEFSPLPLLGIYGGYRYIKIKLDTNGLIADATFKGPFAGLFFRF